MGVGGGVKRINFNECIPSLMLVVFFLIESFYVCLKYPKSFNISCIECFKSIKIIQIDILIHITLKNSIKI